MRPKPGYRESDAGVIPEDWDVQPIGNTMRLVNGRAFKPEDWKSHGTPIIRIQNLNDPNAAFNYCDTPIAEKHLVARGDVLFAWSGTTGTSFGARIWNGPTGVLNQHIFKVHADPEQLTSVYSFLILQRVQEAIEKQAHGFKASFVHVKKADLVKVPLPIPPLAEQHAIAAALSDVDALLASLARSIAKKRELKQAAMQQLLTGQTRLPGFQSNWKSAALRDIVSTPITDGPHLTPHFLPDGVPFLSVNNLVDYRIDMQSVRYISRADHQQFSKKCRPERNDILFGKAASVGMVALVETDDEFNIWSPLALIRVGHNAVARFVFYSLQTRDVNRQIGLRTNSSSQGNIGMSEIGFLTIPLPHETEQTAIAAILADMDAELTALQQRCDKTRALKQAMMQELLTGRTRLVPAGAADA